MMTAQACENVALAFRETGQIGIRYQVGGMTMVFRVQEPALLDKVKEGDKVRFAADKVGGALTVTQIEPAK